MFREFLSQRSFYSWPKSPRVQIHFGIVFVALRHAEIMAAVGAWSSGGGWFLDPDSPTKCDEG